MQEQIAQAVNSVVLLVDKESSLRPERCPGIQVSLFTLYNLYCDTLHVEKHLFGFLKWKCEECEDVCFIDLFDQSVFLAMLAAWLYGWDVLFGWFDGSTLWSRLQCLENT